MGQGRAPRERVEGSVIISNENNVYTQVGFEAISARNVPVFAHFRDSGKNVEGRGRNYQLTEFTHGLKLPGLGEPGHFDHQTGRIDVPARPLQLVFGGPDKRTLFILTHHALYSTRI
jgi:hypothetical protein